MRVNAITVDGAPKPFASLGAGKNESFSVPPTAHEIRLHWTVKAGTPQLSYERAVEDYKAEYARRYQVLMHGEAGK